MSFILLSKNVYQLAKNFVSLENIDLSYFKNNIKHQPVKEIYNLDEVLI